MQAGKLGQRGGHGAGEADPRQQPCPPLRRPGSVPEVGGAGVTGAPDLDEGAQASHEQQPDGEQDEGEDGHRRHLLASLTIDGGWTAR